MIESFIVLPIFILVGYLIVIYLGGWGQIEKEEVIEEYSIKRNGKNIGVLYVIKRTYVSGRIKIIEKRIYP